MQKSDFSLSKFKTAGGEETLCFCATLNYQGKPIAYVSNEGMGGSHRWQKNKMPETFWAEFAAFCKSTYTQFDFEQDDSLVDDLIEDIEEQKALKRKARKNTLFRLKSENYERGEWRVLKAVGAGAVDFIRKKYGADVAEIFGVQS